MNCPSLLPLLLLPVAFVAIGRGDGFCGQSDDSKKSCSGTDMCTLSYRGTFDVKLNLSTASPTVLSVRPRIRNQCEEWQACPSPSSKYVCCANETDCAALKNQLTAEYKPKPKYSFGPITCLVSIPKYYSRGNRVQFEGRICEGDVCSTKPHPDYGPCYSKLKNPCKEHGIEDGCVRQTASDGFMCCCSNRDFCTGYAPTVNAFDAKHSTVRWPPAARPDTLRCHQQAGVHDTAPMKTADATTCNGSACASIGYMQGGVLKRSFGCVDRAECTRLFNDNYLVGCGVLYHQTGRGWLCCCSNGDYYCNFNQYGSTHDHLFLPNVTSPLSPLSPIADVVKAVLTPDPHEAIVRDASGQRLGPKSTLLSPKENPTTPAPPTTTAPQQPAPAPPLPATDGALAAGAWGWTTAALLVVAAAAV